MKEAAANLVQFGKKQVMTWARVKCYYYRLEFNKKCISIQHNHLSSHVDFQSEEINHWGAKLY